MKVELVDTEGNVKATVGKDGVVTPAGAAQAVVRDLGSDKAMHFEDTGGARLNIKVVKPAAKPRRLTGEAKLLRDAQAQLAKAQEAEAVAAKAYAVATASVARCMRLIDALAIDTEQGQAHAPEGAE